MTDQTRPNALDAAAVPAGPRASLPPLGPDERLTLSAAAVAAAVNSGEVSAVEIVEATLARIEARRDGHAYITVCADAALERARRGPTGPLAGVPLAVKDIFDTAGVRTTYGSSIFADHVPRRTATAVARLEAAGAIVVGKANLHEFAWGVTSQNPHWGTVANPARPGRVAGGSSGGTAAALADYQATIGLGTDTGGSIRIPAACCGVVGFKPAYGAVSRRGVFPLAPSFDTVGGMARTVADVVLVDGILTGRSAPHPRLAGLRVGVLAPTGVEDDMAGLGAVVEEAELPELDPDLMAAFSAECAVTHLACFPRERDRYGRDLQQKLDDAQDISAVRWQRGLVAARELRRQARARLACDLLVGPVMAIDPPPDDCWELDVRAAMTRWTRPFNFLGWPAIAIGGLQIAGRDRDVVLGAALELGASGLRGW
jgi:Asp-tRNA(Asn)/Glu-tRNA(Gln) amidotransferase A subunit family amidase